MRLSGTDLRVELPDGALDADQLGLAAQVYPSETPTTSRALFLAVSAKLASVSPAEYAASVLDEGYEPGVHDADATKIALALEPIWRTAGLWIAGCERATAGMWLHTLDQTSAERVRRSLSAIRSLGLQGRARDSFVETWRPSLVAYSVEQDITIDVDSSLDYLIRFGDRPSMTAAAHATAAAFDTVARTHRLDIRASSLGELTQWILDSNQGITIDHAAEAAWSLHVATLDVDTHMTSPIVIEGLVSQHPTVSNGQMRIDPPRAITDVMIQRRSIAPKFRSFAATRRALLQQWRATLGLESLRPRVTSSFVRNRLIDEVYLPLIGDNLANQLGLNGTGQGMLLLISPPGYGKTSLVEYICDLLGFALVRISGPALGRSVTSLDPAAAPDATSAAELVKLNRGLAMGSNVVIYVDDIQHTSAEFLQKFLPLCDASRRIEGVIDGAPVTFELAGRRVAVVMAGNPYGSDGTEFRIPDMLANRANIHNLGDIASKDGADAFAQSYVEIGAVVNDTLRPVLGRSRVDFEHLLAASRGEPLSSEHLEHAYGAHELGQIIQTLRLLGRGPRHRAPRQSCIHRLCDARAFDAVGAAIPAAGLVPEHGPHRGTGRTRHDRRRARRTHRRPLPGRSPNPGWHGRLESGEARHRDWQRDSGGPRPARRDDYDMGGIDARRRPDGNHRRCATRYRDHAHLPRGSARVIGRRVGLWSW